jgi:cell fate (sporulation/competence/biofilm development) regulator YlbF (YheA/YmcA/DUF963 family)
MADGIEEKARELGRLVGQTPEFKTLQRAREAISGDRDSVTLMNRLADLETQIARSLQRGEEPSAELQQEYEGSFEKMQASSLYQSLVSAQSNFDKVLARVNEEIGKGMEQGSQSRIILPS